MTPPPPPEQDKLNAGMYHSHGIEVYHKPRSYETINDAGFNLQKLAWIAHEKESSPQPFTRVRVVSEVNEDTVLVEHEDGSKVKYRIPRLSLSFYLYFLYV